MTPPPEPRFSSRDLRAMSQAILEIHRPEDRRRLDAAVVAAVAGLVGSDVAAFNEIDHAAGVFHAVHNYRGSEPERYFPLFLRHEPEFELGRYVARTGERRAVKASDFYTLAQLQRTGLYNEFYRRFGVREVMAGYTRPEWGCQVCVSLHRARRDFDERDRARLTQLLPHVALALRNIARLDAVRAVEGSSDGEPDDAGHEVVGLTRALRVTHLGERLARSFRLWFPGWTPAGRRLPEALDRRLKAILQAPPERLIEADGRTLRFVHPLGTLTAAIREDTDGGFRLQVRIEARTWTAVGGVPAGRITPREQEVWRWLCEGKRNAEIGLILGASPNTVRKHVQRLLAKTGTETRTALARLGLASFDPGTEPSRPT